MEKRPKLEFHHIGVPVREERPNERYSKPFGMYTSDGPNRELHIQFHRFDEDSILDRRIREAPHIAFKTDNIEAYLQGKEIIMPLYEPFQGYKVAMILLDGVPIEIIETTLTEEEIWQDKHKDSVLYPSED